MTKEIWLLSRELEGWAEAGGVKDVVRDQAQAFGRLGWQAQVFLPLYGFLAERVKEIGECVWRGQPVHPAFHGHDWEVWRVEEEGFAVWFFGCDAFATKAGIYTLTAAEAAENPRLKKGEGYPDSFAMNLEFQWGIAQFWQETARRPRFVLCHDGHLGFVPAICHHHQTFSGVFDPTKFFLLIHNAGPGYRQEMPDTPQNRRLLHLPAAIVRRSLLSGMIDPLVSAAREARLATVSQNYAQELLTGKNDHWSGSFGRFLRENKVPLKGINNGILLHDKDPRYPARSGLPAGFNPLTGDWEGKVVCRSFLREKLLLRPSQVYGRMARWNAPLYISQGRLTSQKGIEALIELIERALDEQVDASFVVMAQGEHHYEERMVWLARNAMETGRLLFINKYEDQLARLLFAAGDFLIMPSEYEPCGLTDLKAQLMGTLPIVHRVGGLVKVLDGETGFSYEKGQKPGLWGTFLHTLRLASESPETLLRMRRQAFVSVLENSRWEAILDSHYLPWLTENGPPPIVGGKSPT